MKIGPGRDSDSDLWQGRHVGQAAEVLIDGKPTNLKIRWFDPENDTYGFCMTDEEGRIQRDPNDHRRLWIEIGYGKVTLGWATVSDALAPTAQAL